MPHRSDSRDARTPGARSHSAHVLGPYETAYDVRRGYTEPDRAPTSHVRHDADEVWRGRGRDER
jgi:hypothetical protein